MTSTPSRGSGARDSTVRVCRCALLVALALALAALESLLPLPMPVPGMKLGIANVACVAAAYWLGPASAAAVLIVRVVLAAMVTGQLAALPFSLVGGGCALAVTLAFVRFLPPDRVRLCCMGAAIAHNCGQMAVAAALTATPQIALYLPVLLVAGTAAGYLTGTLAAAVLERLPRTRPCDARQGRRSNQVNPTPAPRHPEPQAPHPIRSAPPAERFRHA